jgi:histone acetyltransferase (RNA polymerase elongator complex component)
MDPKGSPDKKEAPAQRPCERHYVIPVFIPGMACPYQCIYCDQKKITGHPKYPSADEIRKTITERLDTIPSKNSCIEIGFFGGTFTGLSTERQKFYLDTVLPFHMEGNVRGFRLSTRPDCISPEILDLLKQYPVTTIELGAQSMDDEVLKLSNRGHSAFNTKKASQLIRDYGFSLGLQMMIGLPGDTPEKSLFTAQKIVEMGAECTRIYPVLVIRGTELEKLFLDGEYHPLDLDQAVEWSKPVVVLFEEAGVNMIRIGIHPSKGLETGRDLAAGPYHPAFRDLVMTAIWNDRILEKINGKYGRRITVRVNPSDINHAVGYQGRNRTMLHSSFREVRFKSDPSVPEKTLHVSHS